LGEARIDGVASVAIRLVPALVAALLAREAKGLLIGESADPQLIAGMRSVLRGQQGVVAVNHVRTIHTSPDKVFVAISADFDDDLAMGEAETIIARIEHELRQRFPQLTSIYIRPEKAECSDQQA